MTTNAAPASSSKPPGLLHVTTTNDTKLTSTTTQSSSHSAAAAGGGHSQACAACKYRRRKCTPDCLLAPYFPADQQRVFLNALRLFGVSNIQKTLQNTKAELHSEAMRALIFESEARALNPVGGCVCIVAELQAQLRAAKSELETVLRYLDLCRQQQAAAGAAPDQDTAMNALYANQEMPGQTSGVQDHFFEEDQIQPPPHQIYNYYYDGTAESSSHAWSNVDNLQQHNGNGDGLRINAGSPLSLEEQLEQHCQVDEPFLRVYNVKQEMSTTMMEHDGIAGADHQEERVVAVPKNAQVGQKAPHCQLELGFSSF